MRKEILFLVFIGLLLPMATAVTVSPATATVDELNNDLRITTINSTEEELMVSIELGEFENVAMASKDSIMLPPGQSGAVRISFYDGISKKGKICVVETTDSGVEGAGAAVKACTTVTVNTTGEVSPSETLAGTMGPSFANSQALIVNDLLTDYEARISSLDDYMLPAYVDNAVPLRNQARQKRNEIEQVKKSGDMELLETKLTEFYAIAEGIENKLPIVTIKAQKSYDYFVIENRVEKMNPDRVGEISEILSAAGITDPDQISEVENSKDNVRVLRSIQVLEIYDRETKATSSQTNVKIFLTNRSPSTVRNAVVVEMLPKDVQQSMDNVIVLQGSDVLEPDPVFEMFVGDLEFEVKRQFSYKILASVPESSFDSFKLPVVLTKSARVIQAEKSLEVLEGVLEDLIAAQKARLAELEGSTSDSMSGIWPIIVVFLIVVLIAVDYLNYKKIKSLKG